MFLKKNPFCFFLFCFASIVCSEKSDTSDGLTNLLLKTTAFCIVTGAMSAGIDYAIFCPVGFITEIPVRKAIIEELVFNKDNNQKNYVRKKNIAAWVGWGASWASYTFVGRMLKIF